MNVTSHDDNDRKKLWKLFLLTHYLGYIRDYRTAIRTVLPRVAKKKRSRKNITLFRIHAIHGVAVVYYALSEDFALAMGRDSWREVSLPSSWLLLLIRSARFDWALTRRLTRDSRGESVGCLSGRRPPRPYFFLFSRWFAVDGPARLRVVRTTSHRSSHSAVPPSLEQSKDMRTRKSRRKRHSRAYTAFNVNVRTTRHCRQAYTSVHYLRATTF